MLGKRRWEVNDTSQAPEQWANHRIDLLAHRPFRDFRFARPAVDGKVQYVSINGDPIYDEAGEFAGYRGTGRDITALVEAEAELRRSKEQAEASSTAKSTFLANMSHELRTPLNAIIGFAELILTRRTGTITDDHLEWAGDILASGRHLLDLINDVLELSRIEAGRYDLADDTVDLGTVSAVLSRNDPKPCGQETGADRMRDPAQCGAWCGPICGRSSRSCSNLLTNAVKFTPGRRRGVGPHRTRHGRGDLADRCGYRNRHRSGSVTKTGQALRAGGCLDQPAIWRQRAWAGDQQPAGGAAWRHADDQQCAGPRHLGSGHACPERAVGELRSTGRFRNTIPDPTR